MTPEIKQLIDQCEANVFSFDNDQMSTALHWGETMQAELHDILALLDDQKLLLFEIHAEVKARLQKLVGEHTEG